MEEYEEFYWLSEEVPEELCDEMFDWMFEQANVIYSYMRERDIQILLRSN